VAVRHLERRRPVRGAAALADSVPAQAGEGTGPSAVAQPTFYRTIAVEGVDVFYREAGDPQHPTILLLHGFPSSSHMFRDLIPLLADRFHLVAPDYPGFGNSGCPPVDRFAYTFDHLADVIEAFLRELGLARFSVYMQDYGGPIGLRLATRHPDRIEALIVQNANAYQAGITATFDNLLRPLWEERAPRTEAPVLDLFKRDGTIFQYVTGARNPERMNPDAWNMDQYGLDRPGNAAIQLELQANYHTNLTRYPEWHAYFRRQHPPTLVVWGEGDPLFGPEGARAYARDLPDAEIHLLDTGHFALEDHAGVIAGHIRRFLGGRAAP
jgi:pimeloyl-ACP methyl ester carboxylesterase